MHMPKQIYRDKCLQNSTNGRSMGIAKETRKTEVRGPKLRAQCGSQANLCRGGPGFQI